MLKHKACFSKLKHLKIPLPGSCTFREGWIKEWVARGKQVQSKGPEKPRAVHRGGAGDGKSSSRDKKGQSQGGERTRATGTWEPGKVEGELAQLSGDTLASINV